MSQPTIITCKYCDAGDTPTVIDRDGVLSSLSGQPGCWGHSYGDDWWPCQRKAAEEHAIVERLTRMSEVPTPTTVGEALFAVIIAADRSGSPEAFCARVVDVLVRKCMKGP